MCHGVRVWLVVAFALLSGGGVASLAAQGEVGARGPRFFSAGADAPVPLDVRRVAVLRRTVSLDLPDATLGEALAALTRESGLRFTYSKDVIALDSRVQLEAKSITVAAALSALLVNAGVDVVLTPNGQAILTRQGAAGAAVVQAGTVTGRVTDANTGEGLSGADVLVEGTRSRGSTGVDGRYRILGVEAGSYTLAVRRIGYRRQVRPLTVVDGEEATVDVALEPQPTQLDEVVTTVTGEQRLRELGHVVGRINADSTVKEAPVSSLSELLTGRVPGLQVFQSQGTVGGRVNLQIRGPNSFLLGNEPIVIIDGVRYTSTERPNFGSSFSGTGFEPTSPLNDINVNDIESIEVVKGPSAATLYGTDAANGVLVITTKRGRAGPTRWNAYARSTVTEVATPNFRDLYWGWGTVSGVPNNALQSCTLSRLASSQCTQQDSITPILSPLNDPDLSIFSTKPRWEYGANVAGGRQDLRYYFSGDYEDATGPVQMPPAIAEQLRQERGVDELPEEWRNPNAMAKLNLRSNVTAVLGDEADLAVNTGYVHSTTRSFSHSGPYSTGVFLGNPTDPYSGSQSPEESFLQTSAETTDRFVGSGSGQWRPTPWLATRATIGVDLTSANRSTLVRRGDMPSNSRSRDGSVTDERVRRAMTSAELGATVTARRGRLMSRTAVGAQYVRHFTDGVASQGRDLPPGGTSVGEAVNIVSRQGYAETVTLGSYLEETVGLNDRLFLTGALRVDGASSFGRDYDATVYPKISASWLLSDEPFVPHVPGLDELRLRYAYGTSGQQPNPAWARPEFDPQQAMQNGQVTHGTRLVSLGNPDLRPQRVREHEFGFDVAALTNRVGLEVTWFRRRTVDQIVSQDLPLGLGSVFTNLGLTTQRGFEAQLRAQVLDTRHLSWDLMLQHASYTTKLVDLGGAVEQLGMNGGWKEGFPLGARFVRPLLGYTELNGDGIITFNEIQLGETPVYMGQSMPPRSQTLTSVLGLFDRRLRLSALVERRAGFTQINWTGCLLETCRAAVDPATPLQTQAELAAGVIPEPGEFTRLREVTAALDLPRMITGALRIRSATLALSARNLALWTDFSGADPESAGDRIPQGRTWALRLDVGL